MNNFKRLGANFIQQGEQQGLAKSL